MASIVPGAAYNIANQTTIAVITQGLVDLGILNGDVSELIEQAGLQRLLYAQLWPLVGHGCARCG